MTKKKIVEEIRRKFNMSEEDFTIFKKQLKALVDKEVAKRLKEEKEALNEKFVKLKKKINKIEELETENVKLKGEIRSLVEKIESLTKENTFLREENEALKYEMELQEVLEKAKPFIRNENDERLFNVLIEGITDIEMVKKKVEEFIAIKKQEPIVSINEEIDFPKPKIDLKSRARERIISRNIKTGGGKFNWDEFTEPMIEVLEKMKKSGK